MGNMLWYFSVEISVKWMKKDTKRYHVVGILDFNEKWIKRDGELSL